MQIVTVVLCVLSTGASTSFGAEHLVQLTSADQNYTGKIVALTSTQCTLLDRQGRLVELKVPELTGMSRLANRYTPDSVSTFRSQLQQELGRSYELAGTTHYLVCAPRGSAQRYAALFEQIYRDVELFYRTSGFQVKSPDVPLVAIVFASRREFAKYCVRDQVAFSPGLQGYYSLVTNRVALFDEGERFATAAHSVPPQNTAVAMAGIAGQTADTIVHETIHQVGYNIGIHSRLGETPLWLVEGLATVLEPHEMRQRQSAQPAIQRVNPERFQWFRTRHQPARSRGFLARFLASDQPFRHQALDAYSEAWALCFFLMENPTRRRGLADYLKKVSARGDAPTYSAQQRLADVQAVFGDIARLEVEFLRYLDRLQ